MTDTASHPDAPPAGPATQVAGPAGTVPASARLGRRLRRVGVPMLVMAPFTIYAFLGLGIPVISVIYKAFHSETGKLTTANIRLLTTGIYRLGFYNSIKLSLITAVIPGILGVFIAYAIHTSESVWLKRLTTTAAGVLANFGGVNLTFMFIAAVGETGVTTEFLNVFHLNPWHYGFNLFSFYGIAVVYLYFQIPLMVLVITPALGGLRASWREAAQNMGASSWRYWRHVGIPVLMPSFLGGVLLLFGSAFSAYATAESLTTGIVPLAPIEIGNLLDGNVISNEVNVGYAIGFGMLIILTITMVLYALVRRRASKWLR